MVDRQNRRRTRKIKVGDIYIGGDSPISVQSMTKSKTWDLENLYKEIDELVNEDCQIIRITVPDDKSASVLKKIRKYTTRPLVADIHYDYRMAIKAIEAGFDKIRINPGNIGDSWKVKEIIKCAIDHNIPIRIGVNSGSIPRKILEKYSRPTAKGMMETVDEYIKFFNDNGFFDIVVSLKSSDVKLTIQANTLFSKKYDYPLHIGLTEAGPGMKGIIKSSIAIGYLLLNGIGDTIRVSLTGSSAEEVRAGYYILKSIGFKIPGINIISCPTCGRTQVNLVEMVNLFEKKTRRIKKDLTVAIMGCVVNGPGEAREADVGVAFGKSDAVLFKRGEIIEKIRGDQAVNRLIEEVKKFGEE